MSAIDLATEATLALVERAGLAPRARVLEIGCGRGHLAASLVARGYRVVAIDVDEACVVETRARGVEAHRAEFPDFEGRDFDAVLFTRSLHHVHELDGCLSRAAELLANGGALVVEDWAWNEVDRSTAAWAYGMFELLQAAGLAPLHEWQHPGDPHAAWHAEHTREHRLHTAEAMLGAIRARFPGVLVERAPYFYRYVCRYLDEHPAGRQMADAALRAEERLVELGSIIALGLRVIARRP